MPLQEIQPLCPNCQTPLEKMDGKFGQFWGCKQFRDCGFKGYSVKGKQPDPKPQVIRPEQPNKDQIIMEELARIVTGLGILRGEHKKLEDLLKSIEAQIIGRQIK